MNLLLEVQHNGIQTQSYESGDPAGVTTWDHFFLLDQDPHRTGLDTTCVLQLTWILMDCKLLLLLLLLCRVDARACEEAVD